MALAPKNWSSFQHYKDRAPVWIKLHRSLLDDYEFACLPVASRALAPLLWLLASEYEGGKITLSIPAIAFRLRMSEKELRAALMPLIESGFFIDDSEPLADCYQGAIPEKEREIEIQDKTERDIRAVGRPTRPANDDFEEFWKAYPSRGTAANPKAPAKARYETAVRNGADPAMLLAALKAGAGIDRNKIGTEFVPRASTWLSEKRWQAYLDGSEADAARRMAIERDMAARGYFWRDDKWTFEGVPAA